MSFGGIFSIATLIVFVAMAGVVLSSPNTSSIINALGSAFSGALAAATGGTIPPVKKAA
jgi:hypothetical protein